MVAQEKKGVSTSRMSKRTSTRPETGDSKIKTVRKRSSNRMMNSPQPPATQEDGNNQSKEDDEPVK